MSGRPAPASCEICLHDILGGILPHADGLVVVFRFYLDESERDGILAVGGYLASAEQWETFESEWGFRLRQAGVSAVHATDFNNRRGEFKDWTVEKQIEFSKYFTAVAEKQTEVAIGRAVELAAFDELLAPTLTQICWTPHNRFTALMWCVRTCLESLVVNHSRFIRPRDPLAVIFEQGDGVGEVIDYLRGLQKRCRDPRNWSHRITSFADGPKSLMPLQAADLIVHEGMRSVHEKLAPSGRPPRKSVLRLTRTERVELKVWTWEDVMKAVPKLKDNIGECEKRSASVTRPRRISRLRILWLRLVRAAKRLALRLPGSRTRGGASSFSGSPPSPSEPR